ncbi:MAG TPA: hypothetical protein DC050_03035, partial [Pseudomonas sp.]|nr:hypothetical protein [Pseudomonas sp.]
ATLRPEDLLVQPALSGYGSTDFSRAEQLIDAGYRAASALQGRLASMSVNAGGNPALSLARTSEPRTPMITGIRIENDSKVGDRVIRRHIRQELGEPLDLEGLQKDMGTLYGLEYFEQVEYRIVPGSLGNTLVISAREKRSGTDYLRLGLNLSDDFRGDSAFNIGASYRKNGINELGA